MKSDGEMAIKVVRDAVEQPLKGKSQSNGVVEEAGKTVREFARFFKDQLEDKTGVKIEIGAVIVQWFIRWSAMCISRFMIGKDGKTAFERWRGSLPDPSRVFWRSRAFQGAFEEREAPEQVRVPLA